MNDLRMWAAGAAAVALALALAATHPARAQGDPTFGDWLTEAKDGKVRVGPCAADATHACGTLTWAKPPPDAPPGPLHDARNPDAALRSRPLIGALIISDFRREAPGHWAGGKIYDPASGKTYKSKMSLAPDGTLKVSGCVLMFCQAQTWTRVN
jgi:uncharacterized protein (DUF2147 family)